MSEKLEEAYEQMKREARAAEEMLFFVLDTVGEPIFVSDELMHRPLGERYINVDRDEERSGFVFSVQEVKVD